MAFTLNSVVPWGRNYEEYRNMFLIYQFDRYALEQRIDEVRGIVIQQMKENIDHYVWNRIRDLKELEEIRMSAMKLFLEDYDIGKSEGRYVYHELPDQLQVEDDFYDIGLSSHFLLMYTALGYTFHVQAMTEMLRVCKEIRVFPVVDLDAQQSDMIAEVIEHFRKKYDVEMEETQYEFQKGANKLLVIRK